MSLRIANGRFALGRCGDAGAEFIGANSPGGGLALPEPIAGNGDVDGNVCSSATIGLNASRRGRGLFATVYTLCRPIRKLMAPARRSTSSRMISQSSFILLSVFDETCTNYSKRSSLAAN